MSAQKSPPHPEIPLHLPQEERRLLNGLEHRLLLWEGAQSEEATLVLLHGFLDLSWSFAPFVDAWRKLEGASEPERPQSLARESSDPESVDSDSSELKSSDPGSAEPGSSDPISFDPGSAESEPADRKSSDPTSCDPGSTESASSDPISSDPISSDPGSAESEPADRESSTPESVDSDSPDLRSAESDSSAPISSGPTSSDPVSAVPASADLEFSDPESIYPAGFQVSEQKSSGQKSVGADSTRPQALVSRSEAGGFKGAHQAAVDRRAQKKTGEGEVKADGEKLGTKRSNVSERSNGSFKKMRFIAPDLRGHGATQWVPSGAYYYFPDYVADMLPLLESLPRPRFLLGHSMGGSVAALLAGAFPEVIDGLILVEGLGPPGQADPAPERMVRWISEVRRRQQVEAKPMGSLAEAAERLKKNNPRLGPKLAAFLAEKSTRQVEDGFLWAFDPLHRTRSPFGFTSDSFQEFLSRIQVPTLLVWGSESPYRSYLGDRRETSLPHYQEAHIEKAGHMVHHDQAELLANEVRRFIADLRLDPEF